MLGRHASVTWRPEMRPWALFRYRLHVAADALSTDQSDLIHMWLRAHLPGPLRWRYSAYEHINREIRFRRARDQIFFLMRWQSQAITAADFEPEFRAVNSGIRSLTSDILAVTTGLIAALNSVMLWLFGSPLMAVVSAGIAGCVLFSTVSSLVFVRRFHRTQFERFRQRCEDGKIL